MQTKCKKVRTTTAFSTDEGPPHFLTLRLTCVDRVLRRPADGSVGRTEDKAVQRIERFPYYILDEPPYSSIALLRKA